MTKKFFLGLATCALAVATAAESHTINLFQPTVIAGKELKPGEYKLQIDGSKITLKSGRTVVSTDAKVESADTKYSSTAVRYQTAGGTNKASEIRVGGSKTRIVLSEPGSAVGGN
ncbi:MAG: hypothetical protein FJW40_19860 [Acidobacteria bacterium]|nr:hypothetical protein [Acidobacteriota bacterium]